MSSGSGGFNKLFIMLPVMLVARKLDGEDPTTIYWLRVAYAAIQSITLLIVIYTYVQASSFASSGGGKMTVYIPSAPTVSPLFVYRVWTHHETENHRSAKLPRVDVYPKM